MNMDHLEDPPRKRPIGREMEPGEYLWCACGNSATLPFCDNSHEGTNFQPVKFVVEKKQSMYLCTCQCTATPPICDGSHRW